MTDSRTAEENVHPPKQALREPSCNTRCQKLL